jgi:hypothetical protein
MEGMIARHPEIKTEEKNIKLSPRICSGNLLSRELMCPWPECRIVTFEANFIIGGYFGLWIGKRLVARKKPFHFVPRKVSFPPAR